MYMQLEFKGRTKASSMSTRIVVRCPAAEKLASPTAGARKVA